MINIDTNDNQILNKQSKYFFNKNRNLRLSYNDFYNEAYIASIDAKKNYDSTKGNWESYLTTVIRNKLLHFVASNYCSFNLNLANYRLFKKIKFLQNKNLLKEDICKELNITEETYDTLSAIKMEDLLNNQKSISSDQNYSNFKIDLKDILNQKEIDIFLLYLEDYSIHEISDKLNLSYEWVRIRLNKILKKIQAYYES